MPRGMMHSAAATIGEITMPVRRSSGNVVTFDSGVGFISVLSRHGATKGAGRA